MKEKLDYTVTKDLRRMLCTSGLIILVLVGIMMFSPLSEQYYDDGGVIRGESSFVYIDSIIDAGNYTEALSTIDKLIEENGRGLYRFAYFDRFMSEAEYFGATIHRNEIYELRWLRIEVLEKQEDTNAMKQALRKYCRIIGYHQEEAKTMLNQLNN